MSVLPVSVRLALWASAAYAGSLPLPDVPRLAHPDVDAVDADDLERLEHYHTAGERVVLVALPRSGDLTGMPSGSPSLVAAATAAGECAYLPRAGAALVPAVTVFGPPGDQGVRVSWTAYEAAPVPTHRVEALSLGEVDLQLKLVMRELTEELAGLDAMPWAVPTQRTTSAASGARWSAAGPSRAGRTEAGQSEAGWAEAGQAEAGWADPGRADSGRTEAGWADPGRADAGWAQAGWADPGRADSGRADPGRADPGRADSGRADSGRADPGRAQARRAERGGAEAGWGVPPGVPPRALHVMSTASRLSDAASAALAEGAPTLLASTDARRQAALRRLRAAADEALAAATNVAALHLAGLRR